MTHDSELDRYETAGIARLAIRGEVPPSSPTGHWVRFSDYESLRARLAEVEGENRALEANCREFNEAGLVIATQRDQALRDVQFWQHACEAHSESADKWKSRATSSEEGLERAEYLIDRYRTLHSGKPVRDLEEAEESFRNFSALVVANKAQTGASE